jgi:rhomboid protease GluP
MLKTIQNVVQAPTLFGLVSILAIIFLLLGSSTDTNSLIYFGANSFTYTINHGEYWRLITAPFLHGSIFQVIWLIVIVWSSQYSEKKLGYGRIITAFVFSALFGALVSAIFGNHSYIFLGATDGIFGFWFFEVAFLSKDSKQIIEYLKNQPKLNAFVWIYNLIFATASIPGILAGCFFGLFIGYFYHFIPRFMQILLSIISSCIAFFGIYTILRKILG